VFEATVAGDRAYNYVGRRVGGLDLRTNILVMDVSWGIPY